MRQQGLHGLLAAVHKLGNAGRQPGLFEDLKEPGTGRGSFLAWLQDETVAAGNGVRQEPKRNHPREIERRDGRDHAERLAE